MKFQSSFDKNEYRIVVSTERLIEKANQIKNICSELLVQISEAEKCVDALPDYWLSDSSELLKTFFDQDRKDAGEIEIMLNLQIEKLNKIISLYDDAEKLNEREVETLPGGIID